MKLVILMEMLLGLKWWATEMDQTLLVIWLVMWSDKRMLVAA